MVKRNSFATPFSLSFLLTIGALQSEAFVPVKKFHLVHQRTNWFDARQHCKERFTDLASAGDDRDGLLTFVKSRSRNGWIGLYRDRENASVWRWTGERGDSKAPAWASGEPGERDNCGLLTVKTGELYGLPCSWSRPFICVADNVILVKENKTWEEALEHCRAIGSDGSSLHSHYRDHLYDLVSLQSDHHHRYARDKIQEASTNEVWTALRFLAGRWLWVDGEPQPYQDLPLCPAWGRHCGTLPKDTSTKWQIRDCMERRNFLCVKSQKNKHEEL